MRRILRISVLIAVFAGISAAQESATIEGVPEMIRAGERLNMTVTLNRAPDYDGASLRMSIEGSGIGRPTQGYGVPKGETKVKFTFFIPADAKSGTWSIVDLIYSSGSQDHPIKFQKLTFEVMARESFVVPTSAEVAINPSQIQLFRREAHRLEAQIQRLKETIKAEPEPFNKRFINVLRTRIKDEIQAVRSTESQFQKIESGNEETTKIAATAFFDDLCINYSEVLDGLSAFDQRLSSLRPQLILARFSPSKKIPRDQNYPLLALGVLRGFELNEVAYNFAADNERVWFNLDVKSFPQGATISYRRRGDNYKQHTDPTDTRLKALPLAIWAIRFELSGYQAKEVEYNPYVDKSETITVNLVK